MITLSRFFAKKKTIEPKVEMTERVLADEPPVTYNPINQRFQKKATNNKPHSKKYQ